MADEFPLIPLHPQGEAKNQLLITTLANALSVADSAAEPLRVQTPGGAVFVQWDPQAALTPIGQLVFFAQFLNLCGLFDSLCDTCPVRLTSPNAPLTRDVLGTLLMGILSGYTRYAHLSAVRFDPVNPPLLGMKNVASEDSTRRFLGAMSDEQSSEWMHGQLRECYDALLSEPWVLDVDTTIKPIYGHQEAAKKGYNPTKPGRPSLAYHSYFIAATRVCLDVDVESGDHAAAKHGYAALWRIIEKLPPEQRPKCIRGDCAYGEEKLMSQCEQRGQKYLFKLRQSPRVKDLIKLVTKTGKWTPAGQGFEGIESRLKLKTWTSERRVIVLRRLVKNAPQPKGDLPLLESQDVSIAAQEKYEIMVLITSLELPIEAIAQLYRDRADVENCFDELKNQWGWGGFVTQDVARSQTTARLVALIYNWWSLFVGLIEPKKHAEAITSRPQLLHGVGRVTQSGRQTTVTVTSTHAKAGRIEERQNWVGRFLAKLKEAAEQLTRAEIWRLILSQVFVRFLHGKIIGSAPNSSAPALA
jgi:hypothetical protein